MYISLYVKDKYFYSKIVALKKTGRIGSYENGINQKKRAASEVSEILCSIPPRGKYYQWCTHRQI